MLRDRVKNGEYQGNDDEPVFLVYAPEEDALRVESEADEQGCQSWREDRGDEDAPPEACRVMPPICVVSGVDHDGCVIEGSDIPSPS